MNRVYEGETIQLINRLKSVTRKLNSKDCPPRNIIFSCQTDLLECFADYDVNSNTRKDIRANAEKIKAIADNYDELHAKYNTKRVLLNQIRGNISNIIGNIARSE
jgi:hypothetical protein